MSIHLPEDRLNIRKYDNLINIKGFIASSFSIIEKDNQKIMNVRYVNYYLDPSRRFLLIDNSNSFKTKNLLCILDEDYNIIEQKWMDDSDLNIVKNEKSNIIGIEDIRLYQYNNKIHYSGSTAWFKDMHGIKIMTGEYNIKNNTFLNNLILNSPFNSYCEKNWIPYQLGDKLRYIYRWYPFELGYVENNKLILDVTQELPQIFKDVRGSSNIIKYNEELYTVVHFVKNLEYFHFIVNLDNSSLIPKSYTEPFTFLTKKNNVVYQVEYCLYLNISGKNNKCYFGISIHDRDPTLISIDFDYFKFKKIE